MVRHWLRTREHGWRRSVAINTVGAVTTGVVLIVVATVKFSHGAWIVILMMPILVSLMLSTRRHYLGVAGPAQTGAGGGRASPDEDHRPRGTSRRRNRQGPARSWSTPMRSPVHAEEPESDDLVYTWMRPTPGTRWRSSPVRKTRSRDGRAPGSSERDAHLRPSSPSSSPTARAPVDPRPIRSPPQSRHQVPVALRAGRGGNRPQCPHSLPT